MSNKTNPSYTIVWGASGGVGLAVVKKLAAAGKAVIAYARDPKELTDATTAYPHVIARKFVIDEKFYQDEKEYLASQGYRITGMVDCVGSIASAPNASMTQRLDDFMKPNLYHQYFSALTFHDLLQPDASIVFLSSIRAVTGVDNANIEYAFAKAALENLTKSLVYMFREKRTRVTCIRCTPIADTKISRTWPPEMIDKLKSQSVYGELLHPDDVATVAQFLLSDESRAITGETIELNRGFGLLKP
jgi:3-oxoacyl-[acyl-carrier protein] reductase